MGDLADISWAFVSCDQPGTFTNPRTNDLRYESNDSREMLNCSFSLKAHLCSDEDVVDLDAVVPPQNDFFSVGDGGMKTPESLISATSVSN